MVKNLGFLGYPDYAVTTTGKIYELKKHRFAPTWYSGYGYEILFLRNEEGRKQLFVHKLVAEAFLKNPENKPQVNHIDGDKRNNFVSNLEWVTPSENSQHAYDTGLSSAPETVFKAQPGSKEKAKRVCELLEQGHRTVDIERMVGVPKRFVTSVRNGLTHKDVSRNYNLNLLPKAAKLSIPKVVQICELLAQGELSNRAVGRTVGCACGTVNSIKNRKSYTNISCGYHW